MFRGAKINKMPNRVLSCNAVDIVRFNPSIILDAVACMALTATHAQRDVVPRPVHECEEEEEEGHVEEVLNDESRDPLEDSGRTKSDDDEEEDVDAIVAEDMRSLEESFRGFGRKYRLINRIGEGMCSGKPCN